MSVGVGRLGCGRCVAGGREISVALGGARGFALPCVSAGKHSWRRVTWRVKVGEVGETVLLVLSVFCELSIPAGEPVCK